MRVGQQMMCQQHRLRGLQMRLAGHDRRRMRRRLGGQRTHNLEHTVGDASDRIAQPQPKQRGHLVISRSARPQSAAEVLADPVDQAALQRAVHVLVGDQRPEATVGDVLGQTVEAREQAVTLLGCQQPGPKQHLRVGLRRGDVVRRQHPVEMRRLAQRGKGVRRAVGKPAAPERSLVGAHWPARSLRAEIFDDRPCTCTKPLAADWSNVSPSS
jgi:hypothetical protein